MFNPLTLFSHDQYDSAAWIYSVDPNADILGLDESGCVRQKPPSNHIQVPVVKQPEEMFPSLVMTLLLTAWCRAESVRESRMREYYDSIDVEFSEIVTLAPNARLAVASPEYLGMYCLDGDKHGLFLYLNNVVRVA